MRRALLLALSAAVVALIAIACGRTGPGAPVPTSSLRVKISAPAVAVKECPFVADLQVVDRGGAPVAGARTLDVFSTFAFVGTAHDAQLQTAADGSASATLLLPVGVALPADDTITARVLGADTAASASFTWQYDASPTVHASMTTAGGVAIGTSAGVVSLGRAVVLDPGFLDELPVDPARVRWAADTSALDPFLADSDGAAGGAKATLLVPPGPHVVYAEYLDCAGLPASVLFHVEGGTRSVADHGGLKGNPTTLDADIADPRKVWLGYPGAALASASLQRFDESDGSLDTFGPGAGGGGNAAQTSRIRRFSTAIDLAVAGWVAQGNVNDAVVYDGSGAGAPTTSTTFTTGHNMALATVCTDGAAYFVRDDHLHQATYLATGALSKDTGQNLTAIEAVVLTNGRCGIAEGDSAHLSYLTASGGSFDANFVVQRTVSSPVLAIGFTPRTIWYSTADGLFRVQTDGSGAIQVFDTTGVPADATFLPDGFDTTSIQRVIGGLYGGVETLWLATDNPGTGPGVLRLATLTPRDAAGNADASFLVPIPMLGSDPTLGIPAGDIALPRDFDGTFRALDSLWIGRADTTSARHVVWK